MELKDAFKEVVRYAEARARGASVVSESPRKTNQQTASGSNQDTLTARDFMNGWTIKEIIEPTVTRPWNAEDAKKHVGFAFRSLLTGAVGIVGRSMASGQPIDNPRYWASGASWADCEFATPLPGTDPAKWGWKPCTVEVPAEPQVPTPSHALRLRNILAALNRQLNIGVSLNSLSGLAAELRDLCRDMEQP